MAERRITGPVNDPGRTTGLGTPDFTSTGQTVTVDAQLNVAHSLGAVPTLALAKLRCTTANIGYGVGDEILFYLQSGPSTDQGAVIFVDATNVSIVVGSAIRFLDSSTFNDASITTTSWLWDIEAWS